MKLAINNILFKLKSKNNDPSEWDTDQAVFYSLGTDELKWETIRIKVKDVESFTKLITYCTEIGHQFSSASEAPEVIIVSKKIDELIRFSEKKIKKIEAAGGLVRGDDSNTILWIFRNGKWDLPKGKIEKGEDRATAAVREVEEECGVSVELLNPLFNSWHTYWYKERFVLKISYWYLMGCTNDKNMKPQLDEGIEKVQWMSASETDQALKNTFSNIKLVIDAYRRNCEK